MHRRSRLFVILAVAFTGACYHSTIETGLPASSTVIQKDWAHGFVFGLIPPSTVETKAQCPSGVARVETQHSFLNMLASFLTWNIYSPVSITVTCASSNKMAEGARVFRPDVTVPGTSTALMQQAFEAAVNGGVPVYVDLR